MKTLQDKILKLIDDYWKFDNNQQPMASWHDKQDLLNEIPFLFISHFGSKYRESGKPEPVEQAIKEFIKWSYKLGEHSIRVKHENSDIEDEAFCDKIYQNFVTITKKQHG